MIVLCVTKVARNGVNFPIANLFKVRCYLISEGCITTKLGIIASEWLLSVRKSKFAKLL